MTIKDYVQRRGRLARNATFWSLGSTIVVLALWGTRSKQIAPDLNIVVCVAMLLVLFPVIAYLKRTKCPRCSGDLSSFASRAMGQKTSGTISCPHCGVSLDEQINGPPLEPALDRVVTIRKAVHARAAKFSFFLYAYLPIVLYALFVAPNWSTARIAGISVATILLAVPAIYINRTPCPNCGRALGMVASRNLSAGSDVKCKACGTGIDAPINRSAGQ